MSFRQAKEKARFGYPESVADDWSGTKHKHGDASPVVVVVVVVVSMYKYSTNRPIKSRWVLHSANTAAQSDDPCLKHLHSSSFGTA